MDNIVADMQKLGLQYGKITCTSGGSEGSRRFGRGAASCTVPATLRRASW